MVSNQEVTSNPKISEKSTTPASVTPENPKVDSPARTNQSLKSSENIAENGEEVINYF